VHDRSQAHSSVIQANIATSNVRYTSSANWPNWQCMRCRRKLLFSNDIYRSPESVANLQAFASVTIANSHNIAYKNVYALIVYLLTLPVPSATCERAHCKVDIIKSAVRASMTAERLGDMVIISSEKKTLDALSLTAVVNRFALQDRSRAASVNVTANIVVFDLT
jgi:hypothetical protein